MAGPKTYYYIDEAINVWISHLLADKNNSKATPDELNGAIESLRNLLIDAIKNSHISFGSDGKELFNLKYSHKYMQVTSNGVERILPLGNLDKITVTHQDFWSWVRENYDDISYPASFRQIQNLSDNANYQENSNKIEPEMYRPNAKTVQKEKNLKKVEDAAMHFIKNVPMPKNDNGLPSAATLSEKMIKLWKKELDSSSPYSQEHLTKVLRNILKKY